MSRLQNTSVAKPPKTPRPPTAGRAKPADASLEHLRKLTAALRGNLEKCATEPGVDPVHDVRTGTRRVQAMVEAMMRERSDEAFHEAGKQWLRLLKRMRRAAAPVRDLDVHRKLLQKLVKDGNKKKDAGLASPTSGEAAAVSASGGVEDSSDEQQTDPVAEQAEHLDAWLHHARQHNSAALRKQAAKLLAKFDGEAAAFASAVEQAPRSRSRPRSAAVVALESFARLVHEMQQLDVNNLHDFRKGAKKARYIAESAAEDAHALAVGKALKRLQDEIGDWHDWFVLSEEARAALGEEGKDLIALLDAERDSHYALSMKTVNRLRGRLMGEWLAVSQLRRRTPTASTPKQTGAREKLSS